MERQHLTLLATFVALAGLLAPAAPASAWGHRADSGGEIQTEEGVPLPEVPSDDPTGSLRVSLQYAFGGGDSFDHGFGGDLRYTLRFGELQLGLFGQGAYQLDDAWRFAGGVTGGFGVVGLEVGLSRRTATADYAGSTGIQVAQYFDLGMLQIGARLTLPLTDESAVNDPMGAQDQGIEGGVFLRWGFDFRLHGPERSDRSGPMHGCGPRSRHDRGHGHH